MNATTPTEPTAREGGRRHAPIRSFVLRGGRLTDGQRRALEQHWPRFGIEPAGPIDAPAVFERAAPLWLEIGFGNGEALQHMAAAHPRVNFVGIEVHRPGIGRLLQALAATGPDNVRILCADAAEAVHARFAPASVERIALFFPDPWPKKRHHKRRLIQPAFLRALARILQPGGRLHLATDWDDYAAHMAAVVAEQAAFTPAPDAAAQAAARPRTRFEQRGERRGHRVHDLVYVRTDAGAD